MSCVCVYVLVVLGYTLNYTIRHFFLVTSIHQVTLSPVYPIQPVVKPVIKPVWQPLNDCIHDTTGCQNGLTTGCIVYTNIQPVVKPVWQTVWQPAVSCIQPVVKPVVQPGLTKPVVSCKRDISIVSYCIVIVHTFVLLSYVRVSWVRALRCRFVCARR